MNMLPGSSPTVNPPPRHKHAWKWWVLAVAVLAIGGPLTIWTFVHNNRPSAHQSTVEEESEDDEGRPTSGPTRVDIVTPKPGGLTRLCVQPGTVEPFESADLYSKVSGFLLETVDINAEVHKGDILARISVPEFVKQVAKDKSLVDNAHAKVRQMEAQLKAAQAEEKAATQMIKQAIIFKKSKTAYRSFRSKALERIKGLHADNAVEQRVVDEYMDNYEAAVEAENAATEAITTAELKSDAAKAKVMQTQADLEEAKSEVEVAIAEWEKAKVFLDYTIITSPYDGVVTKRNFNRGDAIRAFDEGMNRVPIVAVDRTDKMRVVVQVPDNDVPYVDIYDKAKIQIDAISDRPFEGRVARTARAEDPQSRTMRTEIDVMNPDKKLVRNMYGRVTITLAVGSPSALRIPSAALVSRTRLNGKVRVVVDHHIHIVPVEIGIDNGVEVEVMKGLTETDHVVLRAFGSASEGAQVTESNESDASDQ